MRGGGGIRRSHFVAMPIWKLSCDWSVDTKTKHDGLNESNKVFGNKYFSKCYEINKFWINNSQVIHGWLFAGPADPTGSSPGNQKTRWWDQLVPQTIQRWIPLVPWRHLLLYVVYITPRLCWYWSQVSLILGLRVTECPNESDDYCIDGFWETCRRLCDLSVDMCGWCRWNVINEWVIWMYGVLGWVDLVSGVGNYLVYQVHSVVYQVHSHSQWQLLY